MKRWGVLAILSASMFIIVIDTTIMNVSISAIVKDLNTTVSGVQSAISLYAMVMASFILIGGKLSSVLGEKRTFYLGVVLFGIGTLTASFSQNLFMLIVGWSVIEGLGSALMLPNVQVILRGEYEGEKRALGYGVLGAVGAVGAAVGPIAGGFLTTFYTWRYAFRFEAVIVVLVIIFHFLIKSDVLPKTRPKFDYLGSFFSVFGISSIVFGILSASEFGFLIAKKPLEIGEISVSPFGISISFVMILIGFLLVGALLRWEKRLEEKRKVGLFTPSLLETKGLVSGYLTRFLQMVITAGVLFTIPLFLQLTFDLSAIQTGVALIPFSLSLLVFAIVGARLSSKISAKKIIQIGLFLSVVGLIAMNDNIKTEMEPEDIIAGTVILGFGIGLVASQIVNLILSCVDEVDTPEVAGVSGTFEQLGNSLGVAIIGSMMIVGLITTSSSGITSSTIIPVEYKQPLIEGIEDGAQLVSDHHVYQVLADVGAPADVTDEIVAINSAARSAGFKASIGFLTLSAIVGIFVASGLPNRKLV